MEGLIMALQMILALSIIVAIHEFGHLITAKIFGMRVEKYFIGFPPKIFSFNYKGTEYGLGSIPLGGFVKISGIIDESFDTKHINKKPEEWEFRAKPAWQRLIVMLVENPWETMYSSRWNNFKCYYWNNNIYFFNLQKWRPVHIKR